MNRLNPLTFGAVPSATPPVPDEPGPELFADLDRLSRYVGGELETYRDAIVAVCRHELPANQADTAASVAVRAARRKGIAESRDRKAIAASLPRVRAYAAAWRRRDAEEVGRLHDGRPGRN